MRDITPAARRIASMEKQIDALHARRNKEAGRIRFAAEQEAQRALKRAGILPGHTVIADSRGRMIGLFRRVEVQAFPRGGRQTYWWFLVHYRSIRSDGRLGQRFDYRGIEVDHPRDLPAKLIIVEQRGAK